MSDLQKNEENFPLRLKKMVSNSTEHLMESQEKKKGRNDSQLRMYPDYRMTNNYYSRGLVQRKQTEIQKKDVAREKQSSI